MRVLDALGHALAEAGSMTWQITWSLILGFTLSAVGGRRALFDALRAGRTVHAGTYNGHPVNIAAALATLEVLGQPRIFERMHAHGKAIRAALEASAARHRRRQRRSDRTAQGRHVRLV